MFKMNNIIYFSYLTQLDKSNRTPYTVDIYNSNDNTGLPPIQKLMCNEVC